jgi:hypothetical protein
MIEINTNPSTRDRLVFAAIVVLLGILLAWLLTSHPRVLLNAAAFTAAMVAVSLAIDRRAWAWGLIVPAVLFGLGMLPASGVSIGFASGCLMVLGGVAGVLIGAIPAFGNQVYAGWMKAVAPIGMSFSYLLFAALYFGVFTPIGWIMRLVGRDPMHREFDRSATTYWIKRPDRADFASYFRQF